MGESLWETLRTAADTRQDVHGLVAVTPDLLKQAADALEPQKPRHEWDDVRWIAEDGEYEAACWCGWTETAWAYKAAEDALRAHLTANGACGANA